MEFCPLNNENCEKEKIINIIQLKKGKIKEINICNDCICDYEENKIESLKNLVETIEESPKHKLFNLKNKMAAAIENENYEAAAIIKKKIEDLTKKS